MRDKPDLIETLRSEGIELKRRGKNFIALCPFHSEKEASFKVDPTKELFYCFGCQAHGDVIQFVKLKHNLSFKGALAYLGIAGRLTPEIQRKREKADKQ